MDLQKTFQMLATKSDSRHTASEALVVLYRDEDAEVFETHFSGDYVNMKRMFIENAKTNSFFRRILLDSADAIRVYLKNSPRP